jgi:hypothetical protein
MSKSCGFRERFADAVEHDAVERRELLDDPVHALERQVRGGSASREGPDARAALRVAPFSGLRV